MAVPQDSSTNPTQQGTPSAEKNKSSFWTPGRVSLSLVVGVLIVGYGISRWGSNSNVNSPTPVNRVANPPARTVAPPPTNVPLTQALRDTSVQTIDGDSLKLSDFANKVVVINIWATWCGPCRLEMPELVKISNDYKDRVVVLGLATTYNEKNNPQQVKDYVKAQHVPYKIIWDDGTLAAPLVEAVQARSVIPQSFVISRDGKIVKHFTGFNVYSTPQLMREAIEESLNAKG